MINVPQKLTGGSNESAKGFMMRYSRRPQFPIALLWATLCLTFISLVGCQAMMGKSKAKTPNYQDKFSCGEPLPGRIINRPVGPNAH